MTRDEALAKLRPMEAELRARGIAALYLFGSVAGGEAGPTSDVDLMCDFDPARAINLFDFYHIEEALAGELGRKVDMCERSALRPRVRRHADVHAVQVF